MNKLKSFVARFSREIKYYRAVLAHKRTPRASKWLLGLAIGYFFSPVDLIPDFIPILGQLDDILIVPLLVVLAIKMVPKDVLSECRTQPGVLAYRTQSGGEALDKGRL